MGRQIDKTAAEQRLREAVEWARSARPVPEYWVRVTEAMDQAPFKTYTPALGTALLAKATDFTVDALALKESYRDDSYSARGLCHGTLVPAAIEYGFTLRTTGREPLNNQPFFRYDHMAAIDRVRAQGALDLLRDALANVNKAGAEDALAALAAFLRVRFAAAERVMQMAPPDLRLPLAGVIGAVTAFLDDTGERPARTQAFAAAAFDVVYEDVAMGRLYDPSRAAPGDVQARHDGALVMAAEVRAKPVTDGDARIFVQRVKDSGVQRAFIIVIDHAHRALERDALIRWAWAEKDVVLTVLESVEEVLMAACAWSRYPLEKVLVDLPARVHTRLYDIEAKPASVERWAALVEVFSGHGGDPDDDSDS